MSTSISSVLLVEDNPGDARLLREMFDEQTSPKIEFTHVECMRDAEKLLAERTVDVILLDLGLPDAQGLSAIRRVHAAAPRVPLVVLTASDDDALSAPAFQEGAQDYLIKGQIESRGLLRTLRYAVERKTMREALFEEKERAQITLACIGEAVACTDIAARITFLNPIAETMTGWSREEALGRPMSEVFRILDATSGAPISTPNRTGAEEHGIVQLPASSILISRDGCQSPIEGSLAAIPDREGRATGAVVVALRDVSAALNKAQQEIVRALRESEERFRATFEQAAVGIAHAAMDGRWLRVNQRCCDILGYTGEELLASTFLAITHRDDLALDQASIRQFLAGEIRSLAREKRFVHKDGSDVWVDLTLSMARDPVAQSDYFIAVLQDITARKYLEQELRHAQRMEGVGQLAGGIAHDFNNLLTVISGRSEMALFRLLPADPLRRDLELIYEASAHAATLTRQLLAFSRKQVLQPRVVDLSELVGQSLSLLKRLIGEDIELTFVPGTETGRVRVDPSQIEQVIVNLVVNARDAMPEGGRLTVETANAVLLPDHVPLRGDAVPPGSYVVLAVSDTGIGMDRAVQSRIFEPFFTTKSPGKGTGLGLATVYGIVKQSGGNIHVSSEPGHGTTFKIYLPRTDASMESAAAAAPAAARRGTETVLLVEDEHEVRRFAREVLEGLGYTVLEAAVPGDATLIAERHVGLIDLLLTDVVMPGMSGRALASKITAERRETKVLFMSGYTDDAIARHGVLEPGTSFLEKPFTPPTLARKVREALDRP